MAAASPAPAAQAPTPVAQARVPDAPPETTPAARSSRRAAAPAQEPGTPSEPPATSAPEAPPAAPAATVQPPVESPAADAPPVEPPAASPPTAPSAADTPRSDGDGDELQRLLGGWPTIVAAVSPGTRAVLAECRPIAIDGASVTIGFPEAKGFLKDHAERKRADVEAAIAGFLQRPVNLRTVATNIELAEPAASDDLVAEARRIFADDLVDVGEVS